MKNVQANQFYTEMQNVMPTHKEKNIFEHFKTTGTGSVCKCIKRRNRNMLFHRSTLKHIDNISVEFIRNFHVERNFNHQIHHHSGDQLRIFKIKHF